jgi:hypothetical protein
MVGAELRCLFELFCFLREIYDKVTSRVTELAAKVTKLEKLIQAHQQRELVLKKAQRDAKKKGQATKDSPNSSKNGAVDNQTVEAIGSTLGSMFVGASSTSIDVPTAADLGYSMGRESSEPDDDQDASKEESTLAVLSDNGGGTSDHTKSKKSSAAQPRVITRGGRRRDEKDFLETERLVVVD